MTCDVPQVSSFLMATSPDWMSALGIQCEEEEEEDEKEEKKEEVVMVVEGGDGIVQATENVLVEKFKGL